jgi:hypothetical protein
MAGVIPVFGLILDKMLSFVFGIFFQSTASIVCLHFTTTELSQHFKCQSRNLSHSADDQKYFLPRVLRK